MPSDSDNKLSLLDACGMAIGGMVGGGIFAVLGEAVMISGNATFISFAMGGILALITGIVYGKLTVDFDEAGGGFSFIEVIAGPRFAGTVSWFLILGYIFTISLYAYTFGSYASRLLGFGVGSNFYLSSGIIILLVALNLVGVKESGISEDILVYTKTFILIALTSIGLFTVSPEQIFPIVNYGPVNVIFGAALVFVAFEGFQLLTYDYDEIKNHEKNLPKAIFYSILIVIGIYVLISFVLTGSIPLDVIAEQKETALAVLAKPVLGQVGVVVVLVAAVFSTASAILATIFAVSRLANRISTDGQLPIELTDWKSGNIPVLFSCMVALAAIIIQFFGNLHQITTFSSLVFLMVFSVVNFVGYKHQIFKGWKRVIPMVGSFGCFTAMLVLFYDTYVSEPTTSHIIIGISFFLLIARFLFTEYHEHFKGSA